MESSAAIAAVDISDKQPSDKDKKKPAAAPAPIELQLLVLSGGMSGGELAAVLEHLKDKSKGASTHKRRELYWNAYGSMITKTSSLEGPAFCLLTYSAAADGADGVVELTELTKRQRGLVAGGIEFLGHKIKPIVDGKPDAAAKTWALAFSEDDAAVAHADITAGEPAIVISADGVHVQTRYKRVLCKGLSGLPKAGKEVEALVAELQPDRPLRSVSFHGNEPPSVLPYNVLVAGASKLDKELPSTIGHVASASTSEVYDAFLARRNAHLVHEAEKLLAQMTADAGKGLQVAHNSFFPRPRSPSLSPSLVSPCLSPPTVRCHRDLQPIVGYGQKHCVLAYKNALMRRVYVHESMRKFIDRARADGSVELHVVHGAVDEKSQFHGFGRLVFELFYRCDLDTFG